MKKIFEEPTLQIIKFETAESLTSSEDFRSVNINEDIGDY